MIVLYAHVGVYKLFLYSHVCTLVSVDTTNVLINAHHFTRQLSYSPTLIPSLHPVILQSLLDSLVNYASFQFRQYFSKTAAGSVTWPEAGFVIHIHSFR